MEQEIQKDSIQQAILEAEERVMDYANQYPRSFVECRRSLLIVAVCCLIILLGIWVWLVPGFSNLVKAFLSFISAPAFLVSYAFCNQGGGSNGTGKDKKIGKKWVSVYEQAEMAIDKLLSFGDYSDITEYAGSLRARLSEARAAKEKWAASEKKARYIILLASAALFVVGLMLIF